MGGQQIGEEEIAAYAAQMRRADRAAGTRAKYLRDVWALRAWLAGRGLTQELLNDWRAELAGRYAAQTVNSMLAAANGFCSFMRWAVRARYLKVQRAAFRDAARELTRTDYERLLRTAEGSGQRRLALAMECLCATGVRVSELRYFTVEAARRGRADVALKGKIRTILIPRKLSKKLLAYAKAEGLKSGEVFRTRTGRGLSRRQLWYELKRLCRAAGVAPSRVFPHNFRHLFAQTFYRATRDIAKLADVLGHSSIETTRIYLISTGAEHQRQLERLGLVL